MGWLYYLLGLITLPAIYMAGFAYITIVSIRREKKRKKLKQLKNFKNTYNHGR